MKLEEQTESFYNNLVNHFKTVRGIVAAMMPIFSLGKFSNTVKVDVVFRARRRSPCPILH